jgi:hypothetical protein
VLAAVGARKRLTTTMDLKERSGHFDPHPRRNLRSA